MDSFDLITVATQNIFENVTYIFSEIEKLRHRSKFRLIDPGRDSAECTMKEKENPGLHYQSRDFSYRKGGDQKKNNPQKKLNLSGAEPKKGEEKMPPIFADGSTRKRGNLIEYRFWHDKKVCSVYGRDMPECWQKRADVMTGKARKKDKNTLTVAKWFLFWVETYKQQKVTKGYYDSLMRYINNYIAPKLGNIPLTKLSTDDLQVFLNGESRNNTRIRLSSILYEGLQKACDTRKLKFNPHAGTEIKREKHKHYDPLQPQLQDDILNAIPDAKYKKLYEFICCTGMRISEALGFPSAAIDHERQQLEVCQQLGRDNAITPILKTDAAYRRIDYLPELLQGFDLTQDLLFQGISYTMARNYFKALFQKHGFKEQTGRGMFHIWRSTFMSNCSHIRVKLKQIQAWAGHEEVGTTLNIYTQLLSGSSAFIAYMRRLKKAVEAATE